MSKLVSLLHDEEARVKAEERRAKELKIKIFDYRHFLTFFAELPPRRIERPYFQQYASPLQTALYEAYTKQEDRLTFLPFLETLLAIKLAKNMFDDIDICRGLVRVAEAHLVYDSVRPLENWQPKTHNRHRQFSDLVRYLFANYDVPLFLESCFTTEKGQFAAWFLHLAQGGSVRKLPNCAVQLTSRMAHFFIQAPPQYSVLLALRYGQVMALGGDERMVRAIAGSQIGRQVYSVKDEAFWLTVIQFFVQNPMLDTAQIAPLVDYIVQIRTPQFTMKGRTVVALLRGMHDWHRRLARAQVRAPYTNYVVPDKWMRFDIPDFQYTEGANQKTNYHIKQITSRENLANEGREMRHCVYSYGYRCSTGELSIWGFTMRLTGSVFDRLLTLEINNSTRQIVQARGKCNRLPTAAEFKIVERWAGTFDLKLADWVKPQK